jgi:CxxC motif-containing protein (DUF1111 family)
MPDLVFARPFHCIARNKRTRPNEPSDDVTALDDECAKPARRDINDKSDNDKRREYTIRACKSSHASAYVSPFDRRAFILCYLMIIPFRVRGLVTEF